ncbi:hypothetical protein N431DRAFT_429352 [Stipitochalara longipes BDJ]|nr:hypothetical protein N431DRAFT_429352 [Stipitochalara longipes BDJ]
MGFFTFVRKIFTSCGRQSSSDETLPPPRLVTLAQAPLLPSHPPSTVYVAAAPLVRPTSSPPLAPLGQALPPPPPQPLYSAQEYMDTIRKLPFSQFSSVQSKYAPAVFTAEDYIKELEKIPLYQFTMVQPAKPRARKPLSGTLRRR